MKKYLIRFFVGLWFLFTHTLICCWCLPLAAIVSLSDWNFQPLAYEARMRLASFHGIGQFMMVGDASVPGSV